MSLSNQEMIILFIVICTLVILFLSLAINLFVAKFQNRGLEYSKNLIELKSLHDNQLLKAQIQVQEQTFEHISNEIHDNIGQKLSLAKLHLNSIDTIENLYHKELLTDSIKIITESLNDLRDLSRSMSFDFISNNGFFKAIENDINQMNKSGQYNIKLTITGDPVFLEA
jgi:signal transduction histidine kinase